MSGRDVVLIAPWYYDLQRSIASAFTRNDCRTTLFTYFPHDHVAQKVLNRLVENVSPMVRLAALKEARHAAFNRRVLAAARASAKDALVVVVKGEILQPETVAGLCETRTTVYWGIDDPRRFPLVMDSLSGYAKVFCFEERASLELSVSGQPTFYLPNGYDDLLFDPGRLGGAQLGGGPVDISFVGARYPQREQALLEACMLGKLGIWGGDWKRRPWRARYYQKRTPLDACARGAAGRSGALVYHSVPVNLNIHGDAQGLNTRVFEIPGAGGFQLCDDRPGIRDFFEPGKEIELFSEPEEMKEKIRFYLAHEDDRRRITEAGYRRARADHRWIDRVKTILGAV